MSPGVPPRCAFYGEDFVELIKFRLQFTAQNGDRCIWNVYLKYWIGPLMRGGNESPLINLTTNSRMCDHWIGQSYMHYERPVSPRRFVGVTEASRCRLLISKIYIVDCGHGSIQTLYASQDNVASLALPWTQPYFHFQFLGANKKRNARQPNPQNHRTTEMREVSAQIQMIWLGN